MSLLKNKLFVLRLLICHEPAPKQIVLRLLFLSWVCSESKFVMSSLRTKFVMSILRTNINHLLLVHVSYVVEYVMGYNAFAKQMFWDCSFCHESAPNQNLSWARSEQNLSWAFSEQMLMTCCWFMFLML